MRGLSKKGLEGIIKRIVLGRKTSFEGADSKSPGKVSYKQSRHFKVEPWGV